MTSESLIKKDHNIAYNYEYFQQADVCRLCWNKNAITDLFNKNLKNTSVTNLADKIKQCLEIEISEDLFPKKLCAYCCQQVEKFYVFKVVCQETDKKLQEIVQMYLESSVVKSETIPNEEEHKLFTEFESAEPNSDSTDDDIKPKNRIKINRYKRTPTYCNICRKDLEDASNFIKHNSEHHGIENGLFKCFGCEKMFKNRKARLSHEHHFCKGLTDGYKCASCGRFLPSRRHYETHMRDHRDNVSVDLPEDIFKCKHCFKLFKSKDELNKHILEHGVGKKNFVCEKCGRVFTRQDYLHKHKLTHTGDKQHVCPHCNFRTNQRSSLVVHIRKHTGERPYSCDVCPQRCVSSSNLRAHRRRHLGIKQHECTICGKRFGYKETLAEHVSSAHAPQPQPCPLCPARYTRPRALVRHIRAKHSQQQQLQCDVQNVQCEAQPVQCDVQKLQCDVQQLQCDVQRVQKNAQQGQYDTQPAQQNMQQVQCYTKQVQQVQHNVQQVQSLQQVLLQSEQHIRIPVPADDLQEQDAT
ncbi:zinc finger protein 26-like [Aricia agestis]|uniref:zinc finger protein 26-like n=1 Tax=Aricia agestis TaxID=91739 RepID=UPI001C205D30|nr:zinc finger protein 26-like [Aricia agestis]